MLTGKTWLRKLFHPGLIGLGGALMGALGILLPLYPTWIKFPNRDSGVFLYIGWRMVQGFVPYRDVWDHKPPVVFFLNALGLKVGGGSWIGVWGLEVVWLTITLCLFYWVLYRVFGTKRAGMVLLLMVSALVGTIHGGNLPPEYALLFQVITLALFYRYGEKHFATGQNVPLKGLFFMGLLGGMAFLTKQTNIGLWLGLGMYLTWRYGLRGFWTAWRKAIIVLSLGFLLPVVGVSIYFASYSALDEFLQAAFRYNFAYVGQNLEFLARVKALLFGAALLSCGGLFPMAVIGIWRARKDWKAISAGEKGVFWFVLFSLPFEMILVALSGRNYTHYYTPLLPGLSVLSGFALRPLSAFPQEPLLTKKIRQRLPIAALLWAVLPWVLLGLGIIPRGYATQERMETLKYLRTHLQPGDTVLFWGAEAGANFLLKSPAPTRYVYLYPLYTPGYADEDTILAFLGALLEHPPKYVVDTRNPVTPFLQFTITSPRVSEACAQVKLHLKLVRRVGEWVIYAWIP